LCIEVHRFDPGYLVRDDAGVDVVVTGTQDAGEHRLATEVAGVLELVPILARLRAAVEVDRGGALVAQDGAASLSASSAFFGPTPVQPLNPSVLSPVRVWSIHW
jgi:hypothetical protein